MQIFRNIKGDRQAPGVSGAGLLVNLFAVYVNIGSVVRGYLHLRRFHGAFKIYFLAVIVVALVVFLAFYGIVFGGVNYPRALPAEVYARLRGGAHGHIVKCNAAVATGFFKSQNIIRSVYRRKINLDFG